MRKSIVLGGIRVILPRRKSTTMKNIIAQLTIVMSSSIILFVLCLYRFGTPFASTDSDSVVKEFSVDNPRIRLHATHRVPEQVKTVKWPQLILFGDSITQYAFRSQEGWAHLLEQKLERKCDVMNRGFAGYNTRWSLLMMPTLFSKENCRNTVAVVIFLGANDARNDSNNIQYVPIDEYEANLVKIVAEFGKVGIGPEKIIIVGPPCKAAWWRRHDALTGQYSQAARRAAHTAHVDFLDVYSEMKKQKDWQQYLRDGIHFSSKGADFLASRLWPLVQRKTRHLHPIMPSFGEINHRNPSETFHKLQ